MFSLNAEWIWWGTTFINGIVQRLYEETKKFVYFGKSDMDPELLKNKKDSRWSLAKISILRCPKGKEIALQICIESII